MKASDILRQHMNRGDSGALIIGLIGEPHRLRIFVQDGAVTAFSLGLLKGRDCLERLTEAAADFLFFAPGLSSFGRCDDSECTALLTTLETVIHVGQTGSSYSPIIRDGSHSGGALSLTAIENDVIRIMGPIGKLLVDEALRKIKCDRQSILAKPKSIAFVRMLAEELPKEESQSFIEKYTS